MASQVLVAALAALVAVQYGFICLYIVPRLARLATTPGLSGVLAGQWGATFFFAGCAITHVGIAIHTMTEPSGATSHLLTTHLWPHIAQLAGGATFSWVVWSKLELRLSPKGFEERSQRAQAERDLASDLIVERAAAQAAIADLGRFALQSSEPAKLFDEASVVLTSILGVDICGVLELRASEDQLALVAGAGWGPGMIEKVVVPAQGISLAARTLSSRDPIVVADVRRDSDISVHPSVLEYGVVSSMSVVIGGHDAPFGVLSAHTRAPRHYDEQDVHFLQTVANILATAIERAAAEEQSRHRALHDPLTQLPNRVLLVDRLNHALARLSRRPGAIAVLFLDLDDFKAVNDTFGHRGGDELLNSVAKRLDGVLRSTETLARFGSDEFAVLCDELDGLHEATVIAQRLTQALRGTFLIDGNEHFVSASIGIAMTDSPASRAEELLRDADVAMYRAKEGGRGRIELFDQALRDSVLERLSMQNALRVALDRGELRVAYQPQVSIADGSLVGVEALLRWKHPERGFVSPAEFIPLAEETGQIIPIGTWVLTEACRQAAAWHERHPGLALKVSVNVSAHQLAQPDFVAVVAQALARSGARPEELAIEITESLLMQMAGSPVATLHRLRALGVEIHLDDFGTGYSSLGYLEALPLDALKMDRTFLDGLAHKLTSRAIFSAVLTMAEALELPVVAEGVESEEQVERLRLLGCQQAQGYFFARPMPSEQIDELLDRIPPSRRFKPAAEGVGPTPSAA